MEKKCECKIGIYNDYEDTRDVTLPELVDLTRWGGFYTLSQMLDFRCSTNFRKFIYCPYCGEKINWAKIRKEVKGNE